MKLTRRAWLSILGAASVVRGATLSRFPYLGNLRRDRATVTFTTLEPGAGAVEVSTDRTTWTRLPAPMRTFMPSATRLSNPFYQYQAEVIGLRPATEYSYRILVDGQLLEDGPELRLRTSGSGPFKFIAFGDSGQATAAQYGLVPRMLAEQAALVIHTGDVVYPTGSFVEYQDFYFTPYVDMLRRTPFFLSLGNHDCETDRGAPYIAMHAHPTETVPAADRGRYYSFDSHDVHFICLDSNAPLILGEAGMSRMLQWLEGDLAASRQFFRVVFFHHPPFASGFNENDPLSADVRSRIVPILERHNVELVLTGHEHSYQRTVPMTGGVASSDPTATLYITTGGGGAGLYSPPQRSYHAFRTALHHFLRVEVDDGRMNIRPIGLDGQPFDFVSLSPPPTVSAGGAVNSASFTPALAPGGLVSVFGRHLAYREAGATAVPLPTDLAGANVTQGGRRLPLFYASPNQMNIQLPFDVQGSVTLRVTTGNGTADIPVFLAETAPAIFVVGPGQAALIHANGRLVSDSAPATPGEVVILYLTGLGRVNGSIAAGQPAPTTQLMTVVAPVEVEIGGVPVTPQFAGLAPGFAGLYQINFQLPATIAAARHSLQVVARGVRSNSVQLPVGA